MLKDLLSQSFQSKFIAVCRSLMRYKFNMKFIEDAPNEDIKMVLVVRTDLGITKGKIASQCAHAAVGCYKITSLNSPNTVRLWETKHGQAKVIVKTETEQSLLTLDSAARSLGLTSLIVFDEGRTQVSRGTATVLGIGPGPMSLVDRVTGELKLY